MTTKMTDAEAMEILDEIWADNEISTAGFFVAWELASCMRHPSRTDRGGVSNARPSVRLLAVRLGLDEDVVENLLLRELSEYVDFSRRPTRYRLHKKRPLRRHQDGIAALPCRRGSAGNA